MAGIPGWVTVASAAKRLQVSKQAVYARINRGTLEARELYGVMLVSTRSVEAVLREREARARTRGGGDYEATAADQ